MRRNSMEKRLPITDKSCMDRSRCNPESSTSIMLPPNFQQRYQKYQESQSSIRKVPVDASSLENRLQNLQKLYKGVLAKIIIQNQCVSDQAKEIKKLHSNHENNQAEIKRLRGMLGFLQKEHKQTQTKTQISAQPISNQASNMNTKSCFNLSKVSTYSSKDYKKFNSTAYEPQSVLTSPNNNRSVNKSSNLKASRSSKILFGESNININTRFFLKKQERCMSPNSNSLKDKYKFVPSLVRP